MLDLIRKVSQKSCQHKENLNGDHGHEVDLFACVY